MRAVTQFAMNSDQARMLARRMSSSIEQAIMVRAKKSPQTGEAAGQGRQNPNFKSDSTLETPRWQYRFVCSRR
jgi:hypothetical protein